MGVAGKYLLPCCCIHNSICLEMQHDHVLKSKFDPFDPDNRVRGWGGVCGQNTCYHVAAFDYSHSFNMQHDHVLKKVKL